MSDMAKYSIRDIISLINRNIGKVLYADNSTAFHGDYPNRNAYYLSCMPRDWSNHKIEYMRTYFDDTPIDWLVEWSITPRSNKSFLVSMFILDIEGVPQITDLNKDLK